MTGFRNKTSKCSLNKVLLCWSDLVNPELLQRCFINDSLGGLRTPFAKWLALVKQMQNPPIYLKRTSHTVAEEIKETPSDSFKSRPISGRRSAQWEFSPAHPHRSPHSVQNTSVRTCTGQKGSGCREISIRFSAVYTALRDSALDRVRLPSCEIPAQRNLKMFKN